MTECKRKDKKTDRDYVRAYGEDKNPQVKEKDLRRNHPYKPGSHSSKLQKRNINIITKILILGTQ